MKTKKWISELQRGEVFTILENVTDESHYFVALGDLDSISKNRCRPCRVFNDINSRYFFSNVQVYSCGLIVQNVQVSSCGLIVQNIKCSCGLIVQNIQK